MCTTRGIPHLCRWEPIVVRPTPQRPPAEAINATANATIEALSARIAALEQSLFQQQNNSTNTSRDTSPSAAVTSSSHSPESIPVEPSEISLSTIADEQTDKENEDGPRALIDYDVQVAAVALAQLSLAPRTEYVGSGTVLCAIHKVSPSTVFFHARVLNPNFPSLETPIHGAFLIQRQC